MTVDIKERQIWSREQEIVLSSLASTVAHPGARFVEVGSWCGDSAVVLARVAQRVGGTLICVDWWRGNVGTELSEIARRVDVFREFWGRIQREGLDDVVLPLRGRSERAVHALRSGAFDMAFLDGDHRYSSVSCDIREYSRLIRTGGVLCGHDCEGRFDDYDRDFLEHGQEIDCYESVHCGVVMAVGERFPEFALDHGIWSVIREKGRSWKPTHLSVGSLEHFTRGPVPPIASTASWQVFRYGRSVYAIPRQMTDADVRLPATRNDPRVVRASQLAGLETQLAEPIVPSCATPTFLDQLQAVDQSADQAVSAIARCADLESELVGCRGEITRLNSALGRISSTADARAAELTDARATHHALECAVAERDRQVDSLRTARDETSQQTAFFRQSADHERRLRLEAGRSLAQTEAQLDRARQELSHARIDLELRRLGVADANWTSAVDSPGSERD